MIAHEPVHSLQTKKMKTPYLAMKLDIAKEFDKVEWQFVESLMIKMGFAEK